MAESKECNCLGSVYGGLILGALILAAGVWIGRYTVISSVDMVSGLREKLCEKCKDEVKPEPVPKPWPKKPIGSPVGATDESE